MSPRPFHLLPAALGLLGIAACADQNGGGPSAPQDDGFGAAVASLSCDFSGFNSLVAQYFTNPSTMQDAKSFVSAMQTAGTWSAGAVDNGFNVMALIAGAVKSGEVGSYVTGSTLTNELIKCMFNVNTGDFVTGSGSSAKSIIPIDFTASLDPARPGAYDVHGGPTDATTDAVKSRLTAGANPLTTDPISAIGTQGTTWANLLSERALIYGRPVGNPPSLTSYQWEAIRPSASFKAPGALVAICAATGSNEMVSESNFGVLAFGSAAELCPNPAPAAEVAISGWGPAAVAQRLGRLLAPQPLHAAMYTKSIGGAAGGLKSIFSQTPVSSVTLKYMAGSPPSLIKQNADVTVKIQATLPGTTTGVNGVCVFLTGTNNNGTPTELLPTGECNSTAPSAVTGRVGDITGVAEITFHVTKTGNLMLSGNGTVVERTGITVVSTRPAKTNVKP
jgi:hypothetical protein